MKICLKLKCWFYSIPWHILEHVGDRVRFIDMTSTCDKHCIPQGYLFNKIFLLTFYCNIRKFKDILKDCKFIKTSKTNSQEKQEW